MQRANCDWSLHDTYSLCMTSIASDHNLWPLASCAWSEAIRVSVFCLMQKLLEIRLLLILFLFLLIVGWRTVWNWRIRAMARRSTHVLVLSHLPPINTGEVMFPSLFAYLDRSINTYNRSISVRLSAKVKVKRVWMKENSRIHQILARSRSFPTVLEEAKVGWSTSNLKLSSWDHVSSARGSYNGNMPTQTYASPKYGSGSSNYGHKSHFRSCSLAKAYCIPPYNILWVTCDSLYRW